MKAKDIRERTEEERMILEKEMRVQLVEHRFKNFTNRLDDTSLIRKVRRDIARVKTLVAERAQQASSSVKTEA